MSADDIVDYALDELRSAEPAATRQQLATDHVPPDWPDGNAQQVHIDLYVEDSNEAHREAMNCGATLLREADDLDAEEGFQVDADPAGHPFCIGWGHPSDEAIRGQFASLADP